MLRRTLVFVAAIVVLSLSSCGGSGDSLKQVQQQRSGEYTVTIMSDSGTMKHGASTFTLEFRKADGGQLVDVGTVEVSPLMEMSGMAPMMASAEAKPSGVTGRYTVSGNLTMAGMWKMNVKFGGGQSVRFSVNAE